MGDVLSLVERAEKVVDRKQAEALHKKLKRNDFDLEDFREQLRAVKRMGSVTELLGMIPGVKKLLKGADLSGAEGELKRVEAIIGSMTPQERRNYQILNASRRKRIAKGADLRRGGQPAHQAVRTDQEDAEADRVGSHAPPSRGIPRPAPLKQKRRTDGRQDPSVPSRQQEEARVPHRRRQLGVAA
jgi:hypothetical protein